MPKYKKLSDGEWAAIPAGVVKVACCDCGLVHILQIKRASTGFKYRAWRDTRATAAKRRKRGTTDRRQG